MSSSPNARDEAAHAASATPSDAALGSRRLFPRLEALAYLNHAAISPLSSLVQQRVNETLTDFAQLGAGAYPKWAEQRARLRARLERLINAPSGSVALSSGTTRALTDVAFCLPWQRGDRVVLFEGEFPANITPWQSAARLFELETVFVDLEPFVESVDRGLAALEAVLTKGVRLVAVSAVQFQTGLCMPLGAMAELCHAHGAELCVDAIQACGVVPIDVQSMQIDYLASGAHKWMMALEGAGWLYVHPDRLSTLRPRTAGWLSHENGIDFLVGGAGLLRYDRPIRQDVTFFEGSSSSVVGYAALEAGLEAILHLGPARIHRHVNAYLDALEPELLDRGFRSRRCRSEALRSGILSLLPPSDIDVIELASELRARRVVCGTPDGYLRIAPHWPNALTELPEVIGTIDAALGALRR